MPEVRYAEISATPLSLDRALAAVSAPDVGGVALFVGLVRQHNDGALVTALDYTAHPSAESELARRAATVAARYDVLSVALAHRTGKLAIGDVAVVVAVGAVHRGPALEACHALIDEVKHTVPIWKEEHLSEGGTVWVGS